MIAFAKYTGKDREKFSIKLPKIFVDENKIQKEFEKEVNKMSMQFLNNSQSVD